MTIFVIHLTDSVLLRMRAEGPGAIGDASQLITRGNTAFGKPYEYWAALPDGPHSPATDDRQPTTAP